MHCSRRAGEPENILNLYTSTPMLFDESPMLFDESPMLFDELVSATVHGSGVALTTKLHN